MSKAADTGPARRTRATREPGCTGPRLRQFIETLDQRTPLAVNQTCSPIGRGSALVRAQGQAGHELALQEKEEHKRRQRNNN